MDSDRMKIGFMLTLCVVAFALAPPIHRLSRAVEELWKRDCIMPGSIPDRPEGSGWILEWKQQRKAKK